MEELAPYSLPDPAIHPEDIYNRLLDLPEHAHLKDGEPIVGWLMRREPKIKAGRSVLGTVYMPRVQGELRDMFEWMLERLLGFMPEFLVVLDEEYWLNVDDRLREILVYHEMQHMGQAVDKYGEPRFHRETGLPVWCLVGHDIEEFNAVVGRYGSHSPEVRMFIAAAQQGDAAVSGG